MTAMPSIIADMRSLEAIPELLGLKKKDGWLIWDQ
jgi:hypothetical protein